jgi:predicted ATPase
MAKLLIIVGGRGTGKTTVMQWLKTAGFKQLDQDVPRHHATEALDRNEDVMIAMDTNVFSALVADSDTWSMLTHFHQVKVVRLVSGI